MSDCALVRGRAVDRGHGDVVQSQADSELRTMVDHGSSPCCGPDRDPRSVKVVFAPAKSRARECASLASAIAARASVTFSKASARRRPNGRASCAGCAGDATSNDSRSIASTAHVGKFARCVVGDERRRLSCGFHAGDRRDALQRPPRVRHLAVKFGEEKGGEGSLVSVSSASRVATRVETTDDDDLDLTGTKKTP